MNYFEIVLTHPTNPEIFLSIKGTTALGYKGQVYNEYVPSRCKNWGLKMDFYTNYSAEDILRHQLKTAL